MLYYAPSKIHSGVQSSQMWSSMCVRSVYLQMCIFQVNLLHCETTRISYLLSSNAR